MGIYATIQEGIISKNFSATSPDGCWIHQLIGIDEGETPNGEKKADHPPTRGLQLQTCQLSQAKLPFVCGTSMYILLCSRIMLQSAPSFLQTIAAITCSKSNVWLQCTGGKAVRGKQKHIVVFTTQIDLDLPLVLMQAKLPFVYFYCKATPPWLKQTRAGMVMQPANCFKKIKISLNTIWSYANFFFKNGFFAR